MTLLALLFFSILTVIGTAEVLVGVFWLVFGIGRAIGWGLVLGWEIARALLRLFLVLGYVAASGFGRWHGGRSRRTVPPTR